MAGCVRVAVAADPVMLIHTNAPSPHFVQLRKQGDNHAATSLESLLMMVIKLSAYYD